ncbi:MAG: M3 family metallopeptidase [Thermomicrobiales bacterium]
MSALAHELGHSMHSYFTWETQPPVYSDYSIFVAEVASNFNQALVRAHLFGQNLGRDFDLALINEAMSNFHRYFFLMPTLARFELEIHERIERGEALPADDMIELLTELFREAYGPGVTIDADRVGVTWAEFSTHLYGNFYVYQYAYRVVRGARAGEPHSEWGSRRSRGLSRLPEGGEFGLSAGCAEKGGRGSDDARAGASRRSGC